MNPSAMSDNEIATFLDATYSGKKSTCWVPMVKKCLDSKKTVPYPHLKRAVKEFNQNQYSKYFHETTYQYFQAIILKKPGEDIRYRPADKRFLETYVRYAVHHSASGESRMLIRAKNVCRRLDQPLYSKVFE